MGLLGGQVEILRPSIMIFILTMQEKDSAAGGADCSDADMRAAVLAELEKSGEEHRIDEIMEMIDET
jgi:hypothetical protein